MAAPAAGFVVVGVEAVRLSSPVDGDFVGVGVVVCPLLCGVAAVDAWVVAGLAAFGGDAGVERPVTGGADSVVEERVTAALFVSSVERAGGDVGRGAAFADA